MKILFKILDYTTSVIMGAGTLFFVSILISESWNMFFAMIVGMAIGIAVLLLSILLFSSFSTAFEIFPVGMIITMFTGMISGMLTAAVKPDFTLMLSAIIVFSLFAQVMIDLYNMKLKGEVQVEK